jgi:hypothetical protein
METILMICVGIGLAAACGYRIFVPFLVAGIATHAGYLSLSDSFSWIGSWPAIIAFAVATALEIGAYYIPWLDNLLDTIATPVAVIAGIILASSVMGDFNPILKWALAIVAGGGAAGTIQGITSLTRAASTATTGGVGNPVVSTAEAGGSIVMSLLAIFLPVLALILLVLFIYFFGKRVIRFLRRRKQEKAAAKEES